MAAALLILTISALLLIYWFRYACSLVLSTQRQSNHIAQVAAVNGLTFLVVATQLRMGATGLDVLSKSLDRDYLVLMYLLRHARGRRLDSMEPRLLLWEHHFLQVWYRFVRRFSAAQARKALEERSRILNYLAHQMGRAAAGQVTA
jgi:hypothetical protein